MSSDEIKSRQKDAAKSCEAVAKRLRKFKLKMKAIPQNDHPNVSKLLEEVLNSVTVFGAPPGLVKKLIFQYYLLFFFIFIFVFYFFLKKFFF